MLKEIELSIVVPQKGQPGRRLGTLTKRVPEYMTLPEIIKSVRKELGDDVEGCVFLDTGNYLQSVHDWYIRSTEKLHKIQMNEKPIEAESNVDMA